MIILEKIKHHRLALGAIFIGAAILLAFGYQVGKTATVPTNEKSPTVESTNTPQSLTVEEQIQEAKREAEQEKSPIAGEISRYPITLTGTVKSIDSAGVTMVEKRTGTEAVLKINSETEIGIRVSLSAEDYEAAVSAYATARDAYLAAVPRPMEAPIRPTRSLIQKTNLSGVQPGMAISATLSAPEMTERITVSAN